MSVDGTALITGASAGIGRALTEEFAANGHDVVLVARREQRLQSLATHVAETYNVTAHVVSTDLASQEARENLYAETTAREIDIDILVNNVGIGTQGSFLENDLDRELMQVELNVVTPTHLTHLYGRDMIARGRGGILNVASTAAWFPGPFMTVYYASKSYLKLFSEGLADELRSRGVTVTALCPGPVDTEFQERAENQDTPLGKGPMQDVDAVATHGYAGLQNGETVIVTGWKYRVLTRLSNILPNRLTRRQTRELNTPD